MDNDGEKLSHCCKADDCGNLFMEVHPMRLTKAFGNDSSSECVILDFEDITTL